MKRSVSSAQAGSALVIGIVVIVVLAVAGLAAWKIHQHKSTPPTPQAATHDNTVAAGTTSQTAQPLTSGTDDQSLAKDINNINGSVNEGSQNLQSATTATNDQSQVVDVPTN